MGQAQKLHLARTRRRDRIGKAHPLARPDQEDTQGQRQQTRAVGLRLAFLIAGELHRLRVIDPEVDGLRRLPLAFTHELRVGLA